MPLEYYLRSHNISDTILIDSVLKSLNDQRVISLKFSHVDEVDILRPEYNMKEGYKDALRHISFKLSDDVVAVTSKGDTISCAGVLFERSYNLAPYRKVLLFFEGISQKEEIQLIYEDRLFGNGLIEFGINDQPVKL